MSNPVKLTINGRSLTAKAGQTVFEVAAENGIVIPHYCYHPDLSIAGVCRMCMCEVEKNPKLQISCNTPVAEGMVVRTDTEKVRETVKSVLELHLINHPLDCPICDKAGECKLQDFYSSYGLYASRMEYVKVHKPKVVDIGTIVLDSERCILCSRCVRFTEEVTKTNELGIFNRGDRAELRTYDHGPLRNDYTGNLADICPVGALTAKDFRFRQRVWFLDTVKSVCGMCAHGCNTSVSTNPKTQKLFRVEPRRNPEVNKSWICDTGRWGYHHVSSETRVKVPKEKRADGVWIDQTWHEFFRTVNAELLASPDRVVVGLGTAMTNEEITDAVETLKARGVKNFTWVCDEAAALDRKPYDGILKHRDLTPNAMGFEKVMTGLGQSWLKHADAEKAIASAEWLILLGLEGETMQGADRLVKAAGPQTRIVVHASNVGTFFDKAQWVLPNVSCFEKSGTYVNAQGRLQKLVAALPTQHTARDAHAFVFGLDRGNDRERVPERRFEAQFERVVNLGLAQPNLKFRAFDAQGVQVALDALEGVQA